jgi:hypothetical protein
MVDTGGEGLEQLYARLEEQSERLREHTRDLIEDIERRRVQARERDMDFATPNADDLLIKLKSANTPFFYFRSHNFRTPAPGTFYMAVGIDNPDPFPALFLFVHLFVGPGSFLEDVAQALTVADTRFPRLTEPGSPGLQISPFERRSVEFEVPLSGHLEESHYFGNLLLISQEPGRVGGVLDRMSFILRVRDTPVPG